VPIYAFNPFIWWAKHQQQFPNIGYLAHQMMKIVELYIEIIFSMACVIIGLECYWLDINNLEHCCGCCGLSSDLRSKPTIYNHEKLA
jgi:hypothetical protein